MWVPFVILLFQVFVKHKPDLRLKYVLITFVFLSSNFYLSTYDDIVYDNGELCNRLQFYSDISLNPQPLYNHHLPNLKEWDIFKIKGLHHLHLNVNSLLPKIDELRYIAKLSNTAVMGITESKLDNCILDSEIQIENYQMFHCDGNRKGGEVASYVINDLSYIEKYFFPEEIENIFFEILLLKTKPIHSFFYKHGVFFAQSQYA